MSVTQINSMMEEILNDDLPEVFTMGDDLASRLMRCETIKSNTRATVFNLKVNPGGDFKGMDYDGAALPVGNHFDTKKPTISSIGVVLGFNVPWLSNWATQGKNLAIRNVLSEQMAATASIWKLYMEALLNAASNDGVLEVIKDITSAPTYVLENAPSGDGNPFGGYLLQPGGRYDVYADDLTTIRAGGPYRVDPDGGLDLEAGSPSGSAPTATMTATVTADAVNDVIVAQSLIGASINPLGHHITGLQSGTWQGLSRAKIYARARTVDGGTQKLDAKMWRDLMNKIEMFKGGPTNTKGLVPYMHHKQYQNYQNSAQDISQIILGGVGPSAVNKKFDMSPGEGVLEGRQIMKGNHCDPTKAFAVDFSKFRWIETKKPSFLTNPEGGGYFFNVHDPTLGSATASQSWYFGGQTNLGCVDVTGMGVITGLALP